MKRSTIAKTFTLDRSHRTRSGHRRPPRRPTIKDARTPLCGVPTRTPPSEQLQPRPTKPARSPTSGRLFSTEKAVSPARIVEQ